jgi:hypothetical protein
MNGSLKLKPLRTHVKHYSIQNKSANITFGHLVHGRDGEIYKSKKIEVEEMAVVEV